MAIPEYKSNLKVSYTTQLKVARKKANELHDRKMSIINMDMPYEEKEKLLTPLEAERNTQLILIQTLESRINNIGRKTGLIEQSIPNFKK